MEVVERAAAPPQVSKGVTSKRQILSQPGFFNMGAPLLASLAREVGLFHGYMRQFSLAAAAAPGKQCSTFWLLLPLHLRRCSGGVVQIDRPLSNWPILCNSPRKTLPTCCVGLKRRVAGWRLPCM